jgi:hypothetical protein
MPFALRAALLVARARPGDCDPCGQILFVVHRARDGWLALDLTGGGDECVEAPWTRRALEIRRGGELYLDRVFSLHALGVSSIRGAGALSVRCAQATSPRAALSRAFGFGGDLARLLADPRADPSGHGLGRLILFRGLTVLRCARSELPAVPIAVRATPELVFDTPPALLGARLRALSASASRAPASSRPSRALATCSARPTSRSDSAPCRAAAPDSARGRTG